MGREQMVLLKNNGILPLTNSKSSNGKIMVMGPNAADSTMLWGIYFGQPSHTVTPLEGIKTRLGGDVQYTKACEITSIISAKINGIKAVRTRTTIGVAKTVPSV